MQCPLCNTEMRIMATDYVMNNGNLFTRQILTCRNKNCNNFGKEVKTIYLPMQITEDPNAEVQGAE